MKKHTATKVVDTIGGETAPSDAGVIRVRIVRIQLSHFFSFENYPAVPNRATSIGESRCLPTSQGFVKNRKIGRVAAPDLPSPACEGRAS